MTEGDRDNSGELSSFLHLTGWRPLVLALVAGLAGAVGLFGALSAPAEYQARYILSVGAAVDDDFTPQQVDIFVDEVVQAARLPRIQQTVEDETSLVEEDDYEITVNQSPSSTTTIDINVVAGTPDGAQSVAIETGIAALKLTLENEERALQTGATQLENQRRTNDERIRELTAEADGINPSTAYNLAVQAVIDRRIWLQNPPQCPNNDGTTSQCPEPSPPLADLEAKASRLEPLDREYQRLIAIVDAQTTELTARQSSIGEAAASLADLVDERENPEVISEVVTEETSRIAGLLTGLLLFAVPAALLVILGFALLDLIRRKPTEPKLRRAEDFDAAGVLEAHGQRALPEAKVTPLVVVDKADGPNPEADIFADEPDEELDDEDGDEPKAQKRSKDGRWGRDASSKAG
jgi:hypothetical protein